jgi:glucan phosphoethanolaminetransferase (alkaline phosphatase superfamily)
MDKVHLYLFINYLPTIGVFAGVIVFLLASLLKSYHIRIVSYALFIISAIGALLIYLTQTGSKDTAGNISVISKNTAGQYENVSVYTLAAFILLCIAAVIGIMLLVKKRRLDRGLDFLILAVAVASFGLAGWIICPNGSFSHTRIDPMATVIHTQNDHKHEQASQVVTTVQLNNGQRWIADDAARNAISDLQELTNTINDPVLLKQSLQQRINRLFQECTMKGDADKQLHNFLIPLMDKIKQLDENSKTGDVENIQSYLETFSRYFK